MKIDNLKVNEHNMAICKCHKIATVRNSDSTKEELSQCTEVRTILTFDDKLLYSNSCTMPLGVKQEKVLRFVDDAIADRIVNTAILLGPEYVKLAIDYFKAMKKDDFVHAYFKIIYCQKIDVLVEHLKNINNLNSETESVSESTKDLIDDETVVISLDEKEFNNLEKTTYYLTEKQQKRLYERKK